MREKKRVNDAVSEKCRGLQSVHESRPLALDSAAWLDQELFRLPQQEPIAFRDKNQLLLIFTAKVRKNVDF